MYKIDYKGKYFVLQDIAYGDDDVVVGEIKNEEITDSFLAEHVETCIYYGIPPYIGEDKKLKRRIIKLEENK